MDVFSPKKRSEIMSKIRSHRNELTEMAMIRIFRSNGITGWRRGYPLFGHPDFVFPKKRLVVFVDGEFWHGHAGEKLPTTNRDFWRKKIERNKKRDLTVNQFLTQSGWTVLRFWQRELKNEAVVLRRITETTGQEPLASSRVRLSR